MQEVRRVGLNHESFLAAFGHDNKCSRFAVVKREKRVYDLPGLLTIDCYLDDGVWFASIGGGKACL